MDLPAITPATEAPTHTIVKDVNTANKVQTTQNKNSKHQSNDATVLKYVALGLTVITIIVVAILLLRYKYRSQIDTLTSNLATYQSSDTLLKNKLREAEHARAQYANRIKQLTAELSEAQSYNPSLPMNSNSYDAPDPEATKQKPQVLKDREAIKSFVNSKRPTVQDEIDDRERNAEEQHERDDKRVKFELAKATHSEPKQEHFESSDTEQHNDKVENIMNIIQSA